MRRHAGWGDFLLQPVDRGVGCLIITAVFFAHFIAAPPAVSAAGKRDQQNPGDTNQPTGSNPFLPPEKFTTPIQLKAHIERLQKVPLPQRQQGYSEALVQTADKILDSKPPESLREFAVLNLLEGLHYWGDAEKNADADKRLAEVATKYSSDTNKQVAAVAGYYALEARVLNPQNLKPEQVPKLLDEVKTALNGKALGPKHVRIANGVVTLINYLPSDEEAEKRFKDFARVFSTSNEKTIAKLGNQIRTMTKRDLTAVKTAEKPAETQAAAPAAADPAAMTAAAAPEKVEPAADWVKRIEAKISTLAGPAHDEEYQKEKNAFFAAYGSDPLRYRWFLMDARRAVNSGEGSKEERTQKSRDALSQAMYAGDAPEELREQATTMYIKLDLYVGASMPELGQHLADYIARFPNSKTQADFIKTVVTSATKGQSDEEAIPHLEELKQCGVQQVIGAADQRIAELRKKSGEKTDTAAAATN